LNPDEHYPPDDIFFEITGVLETVTGYFIALFTYRLIRDRQQSDWKAGWRGVSASDLLRMRYRQSS